MKIYYHKDFKKRFYKLSGVLQKKTKESVQRFIENPFDPLLRNHALTGKMAGKRAFSVTGNMRVIFEEYNDYILVHMLDIGTHNQVYE